jgi:hypothetical protein
MSSIDLQTPLLLLLLLLLLLPPPQTNKDTGALKQLDGLQAKRQPRQLIYQPLHSLVQAF